MSAKLYSKVHFALQCSVVNWGHPDSQSSLKAPPRLAPLLFSRLPWHPSSVDEMTWREDLEHKELVPLVYTSSYKYFGTFLYFSLDNITYFYPKYFTEKMQLFSSRNMIYYKQ